MCESCKERSFDSMKRNWMKKLVCLGLSLVLLLGNLPVGALAEDGEITEATEVTEVTEASEPENPAETETTTEPASTAADTEPSEEVKASDDVTEDPEESHVHSYGQWQEVTAPAPDALGVQRRECACGSVETQEVEGVWQLYALADHLVDLPENVCCDTNLWALLPHENVHFTSGKRWGTNSTPVSSITIPLNPGDRVYATSWNKAGENGHETLNGIRLTFFNAYGIAQTLGPGESYSKFAANGGYLVAPEGTIAINIAMWYDSQAYEVYILNREHTYKDVTVAPSCTEQGYSGTICLGCGDGEIHSYAEALGHLLTAYEAKDPTCTDIGWESYETCSRCEHSTYTEISALGHSYGQWTQVKAPACDAEGQDKSVCGTCGQTLYRDTRISGDPDKILVSNPVPEGHYEGKRILAIGDSLTAGTGVTSEQRYHALLAQRLKATNISGGTSGATLCPGGHLPNKFETLMTANYLTKNDIDVVTIFLGINDWDNGVVNGTYQGKLKYDESLTYYDLGEVGTDDTTTIYGAAQMWCERILELKATAGCEDIQFVFATPVITSWNKSVTTARDWDQDKVNVFGYTLRQYCAAIMEVCAYYEIPVLDLNMYSGMYYHSQTDNNVDYFGGDGIHPGVNGHVMMADAFEEFLLEGYSYASRNVSDRGHNFEKTVTEATCTEGGFTAYRCPECHYSYVAEETEATGEHSYKNGLCTVCGEEELYEPMSLRYDDHYDVSGKTVEIVDGGKPTSYQVGYGVAEGTLDTAVVTLEGENLVATGIGTAKVRIDGQLYAVTVEAAPISLLLLIGQSNMQGSEGDANQSIVCPEGMVYSTYGDRYTMTTSNATNFAPSALTGSGSTVNVNGTTTNLKDWPVYLLNEEGAGKAGPDSGFGYEWAKQTGEKVWVVNAAHGGSSINTWQDGGANYEECVLLFKACQQTLEKEIAAGHYTLSHMGYFWCQGCTDYSQTAQWYVNKYLTMHNNLKTELAFDKDTTFEFGGIIPVRAGHESYTSYRQGIYKDTTTKKYHESFKDLRFTGPRVAQYWMTGNPELPDIWNVCNIGEDWVWMPDGTNGVKDYFQAHYPGGTVDYTPQVKQSASWYTPTTPAAVHDSIHYNQIGYNEVGREAARNALILLGEIEAPEVKTTVELLTWDGYTPAEKVTAATTGSSDTLVVPKVYPVWKSKEVTCELSEGLSWNYYDLLTDDAQTSGTLTASGKTVNVVKSDPYSHFTGHLAQLPEDVCCGLNLWKVLEHDKYYYASGTGWAIHTSGNVPSITILVNPGDKIYASSFGAAGTNGHSSTSGIRTTYFSEYGVAKTMTPGETYAEFAANGGYLVAPENAVAINIPMWSGSDEWEVYILNLPHDKTEGICAICGRDSHSHEWSDWETITAPSIDGPGEEKRSCACGETESRKVEGVWQTLKLSEHMAPMPDNYCCDTNLWTAMEHDAEFFSPGTEWHVHSSGTVYSVTIPVAPGDKIYATSFKKAGESGGSSSGIRVTFFDTYGVVKTLKPAETYAEFSANDGYLIAPEGAVAVNIPMWNNSDANEIYILNREHTYGDWEITKEVTATAEGQEQQTCAACGDVRVRGIVPVQLTASVDPAKVPAGTDPEDVKISLSAGSAIDGTAVADMELEYVITDESGREVTLEEALAKPGKYTITPKVKIP